MKIGRWTIDDKSHPGRIFMHCTGRPVIDGELLPQDQVAKKAGQYCLGNGLTLKIIKLQKADWYCLSEIYDSLETAVAAYAAAGGKLPTPALAAK